MDGDGDALATNAPATWPLVHAPMREGEATDAWVRRLAESVRSELAAAGFRVVVPVKSFELGAQNVRVDLLVESNGLQIPVFVFPGEDPPREATMYGFLRAAFSEAGLFPTDPVWYAPDILPAVTHPTEEVLLGLADEFASRAGRRANDLSVTAAEVVRLLRAYAGRPVEAGGGEAVQEAAAYVGEWVRARTEAAWLLREDLPRSVLAARSNAGTLQWYLPLFAWFPDAVRMGYDGLADLLDAVVDETTSEADEELVVRPAAYGPEIEAWLAERILSEETNDAAIVLRRCASCGTIAGLPAPLPLPADDLAEVLRRSLSLAQLPPDACPCGAQDYRGAHVAYRRPDGDGTHALLALVYTTDSHTRIAVYRLEEAAYETSLPWK